MVDEAEYKELVKARRAESDFVEVDGECDPSRDFSISVARAALGVERVQSLLVSLGAFGAQNLGAVQSQQTRHCMEHCRE